MIVTIGELVERLDAYDNLGDTKASEALWIKFSDGKVRKTEDFKTADQNPILQVHLGPRGALVSLEIFS